LYQNDKKKLCASKHNFNINKKVTQLKKNKFKNMFSNTILIEIKINKSEILVYDKNKIMI